MNCAKCGKSATFYRVVADPAKHVCPSCAIALDSVVAAWLSGADPDRAQLVETVARAAREEGSPWCEGAD